MTGQIDFIGIGAAKSGSTWLADQLRTHPQIFIPPRKELNFFNEKFFGEKGAKDNNYFRDIDWYLEHFPRDKDLVKGEISPAYLCDTKAAARIKRHFPQAKIIAILRNPIKMIQSFYWWNKKDPFHHYQSASLNEAVANQNRCELKLKLGLYHRQLQRYYHCFPAKNIKVIILNNVKKKPQKNLQSVYRFLGVKEDFVPTNIDKKSNPAQKARSSWVKEVSGKILHYIKENRHDCYRWIVNSPLLDIYRAINLKPYHYSAMSHASKEFLQNYYRVDIEKLADLINEDLSPWLK